MESSETTVTGLKGGSLAERIDEACRAAGVTTTELAKQCDVTFSAAARWRKGRADPHGRHLRRIAEVCAVTVDELLGVMDGQEPPFEAWHRFRMTQTYDALTHAQRRFLAMLPWPSGVEPTVAAYLLAAESIRATDSRS